MVLGDSQREKFPLDVSPLGLSPLNMNMQVKSSQVKVTDEEEDDMNFSWTYGLLKLVYVWYIYYCKGVSMQARGVLSPSVFSDHYNIVHL